MDEQHSLFAIVFVYVGVISIPKKGVESPDGGMVSRTMSWNTARDRSTVTAKLTFSPDSGGSMKPNTATNVMRRHGHNMFMM